MEYRFKRSLVVMGKLAQDAARTPPPEDAPPFEYVDQSLTILGRTFEAHNQKIRENFLGQNDFIASQFRRIEKKMDEGFKEVDERFEEVDERFKKVDERFKEVDRRFNELERKMDERFDEMEKKMDRRFAMQDSEICGIKSQIENAAAITRNGRLVRMHQSINPIKVSKPGNEPHKFVWISHHQTPKNMKDTYYLGQRAKGIFEPSWTGKSNEQKAQAKQKALHTIQELTKFHNIIICSDEESGSDATEVMLQAVTVDDYMEALLADWGMDWQKVLKLGMQHRPAQLQQAGAKRPGDASSGGGEKKKTRGREE